MTADAYRWLRNRTLCNMISIEAYRPEYQNLWKRYKIIQCKLTAM